MNDEILLDLARKKVWAEIGHRRQVAELEAASRIAAALIMSPHCERLMPDFREVDADESEKAIRNIGYIAITISNELWEYSENVWNGNELDDVKADWPEVEVALAELRGKIG